MVSSARTEMHISSAPDVPCVNTTSSAVRRQLPPSAVSSK